MSTLLTFIDELKLAIENETFVKISLGNYKGSDASLKNLYGKLALIKRVPMLSFTFRHQTRDITKNYTVEQGIVFIQQQLEQEGFRSATLFLTVANLSCQQNKKGDWFMKKDKPTNSKPTNLSHDHQKERKVVSAQKRYLQELRLTDDQGRVFKSAQDKWRQINHYIELLSGELQALPNKEELRVVDMGAGKGYLTFALYDYLNNELNKKAAIEGIEYRDDLVQLCNTIAQNSSFHQLNFRQDTIENYEPTADLDILIALHACDTATDDAIYKGIKHQASLIVVAPCCHKQIRRELERVKAKNELDFMIKHGIFLERHAEMLTDSIRALILEYFGYKTKIVQFISDAHTAKNVMIVATKKSIDTQKQVQILEKLKATKEYFGIEHHYLEKIFEAENKERC